MIKDKDAALKEKDAELKTLHQEKDAELKTLHQEKEKAVSSLQSELISLTRQFASLQSSKVPTVI